MLMGKVCQSESVCVCFLVVNEGSSVLMPSVVMSYDNCGDDE